MKIEGCKRINVFIGYPNVGKSNILEALSLFSLPYLKIAGSKKLTDFVRVNSLPELFYGADINSPIHVNINGTELRFASVFDMTAYYPLKCLYKYDKQKTDSKDPHVFFDNEMRAKFENLPLKIGAFGGFEILKYHYSIENLKTKKTVFPVLIPPYGNNLFEIINSNSQLVDLLKTEFAKIKGEYVYDTSENSVKILKKYKKNNFMLPFSSIADTLQRLIFYEAAIASNKNSVLIFEEPEAHMFPPYVSKFTGDVIFDKSDNQFFIATHSPFVLTDFIENDDVRKKDLAVYLVGVKNGETTVKRLTDNELHEVYQFGVDLFFNLESYLD